MSEPPKKKLGAERTIAIVVTLALTCCGGPLLFTRFFTPNVWKLMTMSADDFASPADAGLPSRP